ncbi:MAG: hypothetical protein ABIK09_09755 [Pseudomonadota bacterium]
MDWNRTWAVLVAVAALALAACGGKDGGGEDTGAPADVSDALDDGSAEIVPTDIPTGETLPEDVADTADGEIGDVGEVQGHWVQLYSPLSGDHVLKSVWGFPNGAAWAVGEAGSVVMRPPGEPFVIDWEDPNFDILNGVWGSSPTDLWGVGMYGIIVHSSGDDWSVPNFCEDDGDCVAADPCFVGICVGSSCQFTGSGVQGCCGGATLQTGFDLPGDAALFSVMDLHPGTGVTWQVASLADPVTGALRATSAPASLYFGDPDVPCPGDLMKNCPTFDAGAAVGAEATSQVLTIPGNAAEPFLSFQILLDVESNPATDVFEVLVIEGPAETVVWHKGAIGGSTNKQFVPVKVDLSDWIGADVRIRFRFDSVDASANASEGIYIDDVSLSSDCLYPAENEEFGTLWSVWGAGADDVFAVGSAGAVAHFDGIRWSRQAGGKVYDLRGIGGISADDVAMVGNAGLVLHAVNNSGWQEEESPLAGSFRRVWGAAPSTYVAVGAFGALIRYDGFEWVSDAGMTAANLNGVFGFSSTNILVCGSDGALFRYNGSGWSEQDSGTTEDLFGVWGSSPDDIYLVGSGGKVFHHTMGSEWSEEATPTGYPLTGVWGSSSEIVYAVGDYGTIMRRVGGVWEKMVSGTDANLTDVWGVSASDVWASGLLGTVLHYDGETWSTVDTGLPIEYYDVWGTASDDVYLVGQYGLLMHWNGETWKVALSSTTANLRDVHGLAGDDVYAVGQAATIMHYDGKGWGIQPVQPYQMPDGSQFIVVDQLNGVFAASTEDAWAVGNNGTIVRYNGETWSLNPTGLDPYTLRGVHGWDEEHVWAVGGEGTILFFDGQQWFEQESGVVATLYDVWGDSMGNTYAVGDAGTILAFVPVE